MVPQIILVDPRKLRLPPSRSQGADPIKLQRQIAKHGKAIAGMPRPVATRDGQGELKLLDGATRATRVAKMLPGTLIEVEVTEVYPNADYSKLPTDGERLP